MTTYTKRYSQNKMIARSDVMKLRVDAVFKRMVGSNQGAIIQFQFNRQVACHGCSSRSYSDQCILPCIIAMQLN